MKLNRLIFALAGATALSLLGCGVGHDGDGYAGRAELAAGLAESQDGMMEARHGFEMYQKGEIAQGLDSMRRGVEMMKSGQDTMHQGMGMLEPEMTDHCGGSTGALAMMAEGAADIEAGVGMMGDDAQHNDEDGMHRMESGMASVESGMSEMSTSVSCMDSCPHGGGMMM